jgi:cysteinyl-tRNA synthetase
VSEPPDAVRGLAAQREEKRKARDFAAADELRDRIRAMGWEPVDTAQGTEFQPIEKEIPRLRPEDVEPVLENEPRVGFSVQWLVQGWPEDVVRGLESFRRHCGHHPVQHVVVDAAGTDPGLWPEDIELVPLADDFGWAACRNAGLKRADGHMVVVIDGSVEAAGDALAPLGDALADPEVGIVGPFGIVTDDLRDFRDSEGPEVDAIEGYLMAFRREVLQGAGFFDEKFKFYRTADIEFSFRVKDQGLKAVVVPLPLARHEHRMWANTPEDRREKLSKRNFYRFLDRWRGRTDLTVGGKG